MSKLTPKQKRFCESYAMTGNATQAAKIAGYSEKTATSIGEQNLRKLDVVEYLKELTNITSSSLIATAIQRQEFWTSIMRDDEIGIGDRLRASEILGKAQGDFIQKVEVTNELTLLSDDELDAKIQSLMQLVGI